MLAVVTVTLPRAGPQNSFLPKEPGARNDTFHQLPLLPVHLKEKAESATGAQMAGQAPGAGEDTALQDPQASLGEFSLTNCEVKQFSAPEDR